MNSHVLIMFLDFQSHSKGIISPYHVNAYLYLYKDINPPPAASQRVLDDNTRGWYRQAPGFPATSTAASQ